jgi:hypothetical protein
MSTKTKIKPDSSSEGIDLRTVAGSRYHVEYEQSHRGKAEEPWLLIIPCQRGHIYQHSDELLGVATDCRSAGLALAKLPGVQVMQEGVDGFNLVFGPKLLPKVAKIVKPKRRRQLSAVQRERLAEYAFKPAQNRGSVSAGATLLAGDVSLAA